MDKRERKAQVSRRTAETEIRLTLDLDDSASEANAINTGVGFLNHMLTLAAAHGRFRLDVSCVGDTDVDDHHSVEDIGIAFGEAFKACLGNAAGVKRYGQIILPMDEALMIAAVDLSGRGYLGFDVRIPTEKIGSFDSELIKEFFLAFCRKAEITLHFKQLAGENAHHIAESVFKAFGRALAQAFAIDENAGGRIPSTKGVL
ncbi:MAG: imidazoleglycerol-phosphate dehydratase HisB [Firmicutes bacterium]|nr:imidazoleglycerol-phosphate dehydratase HisB [Bacillota bacterium]